MVRVRQWIRHIRRDVGLLSSGNQKRSSAAALAKAKSEQQAHRYSLAQKMPRRSGASAPTPVTSGVLASATASGLGREEHGTAKTDGAFFRSLQCIDEPPESEAPHPD